MRPELVWNPCETRREALEVEEGVATHHAAALECRLVYCKLYSSSNIDRQRERYFYPVRIVSIDGGARQSAA